MKAIVVSEDQGYRANLTEVDEAFLDQGNVLIRVAYSSLNYKDALAVTGEGKILKRLPLIPGIDVAGVVEKSAVPEVKVGSRVLVNGCGLGESQNGGLAELVKVPAEWIVPLPEGLSLRESMILGTAGFTAALAAHRMLTNGQVKEMGPLVVTGASGGVGSVAVDIFSRLGFEVWAVSGKPEQFGYLQTLGAARVLSLDELELGKRPLEKAKFGGAVDNVGGETLAGLLRHINLWGNVASIGLAQASEFHATVMPHILRGVSLLGISSANCPMGLRRELWNRLGQDLRPRHLDKILHQEITLDQVEETAEKIIGRQIVGRTIVRLAAETAG